MKARNNIEQRIFFDLEETVIDSFMDDERFINLAQMRNFIKDRNIKKVEIFSRALWEEKERDHFNRRIRKNFPIVLNIEVIGKPIINPELMKMITKQKRISTMSRGDFFDFFGKQDSFMLMVEYLIDYKQCKDTHFVLVDDMVKTMNVEYVHRNVTVEIINVRDIVNDDKYN